MFTLVFIIAELAFSSSSAIFASGRALPVLAHGVYMLFAQACSSCATCLKELLSASSRASRVVSQTRKCRLIA